MPKTLQLRRVTCYHCSAAFEVGSKAITVSCPACYQRVAVEDVRFKGAQFGGDVRTCGAIDVAAKSHVSAKVLQSSGLVEIKGAVEARLVAGARVTIATGARVRGDLSARTLRVDPGARIEGGFFRVGELGPETPPSSPPIR